MSATSTRRPDRGGRSTAVPSTRTDRRANRCSRKPATTVARWSCEGARPSAARTASSPTAAAIARTSARSRLSTMRPAMLPSIWAAIRAEARSISSFMDSNTKVFADTVSSSVVMIGEEEGVGSGVEDREGLAVRVALGPGCDVLGVALALDLGSSEDVGWGLVLAELLAVGDTSTAWLPELEAVAVGEDVAVPAAD